MSKLDFNIDYKCNDCLSKESQIPKYHTLPLWHRDHEKGRGFLCDRCYRKKSHMKWRRAIHDRGAKI